jgi:hypothetical protein
MRALRRLTVLLAGTLLLMAADGEASIIVQQGIAGVELHMTKSQVRSLLGEPPRIRAGRNLAGPFTQFVYPRLIVEFQRVPTVTALRTSSPLERTPAGVGVGSTEAQVERRLPHVACESWSGHRQCVLGKVIPDRTVTIFALKSGRVSNIIVGVVQEGRSP